jgi:chitodextrinase
MQSKSFVSKLTIFIPIFLIACLVGCGGGGGSDTNDATDNVTSTDQLVLADDISFVSFDVVSETKTRTVTDYSRYTEQCTYTYIGSTQIPNCTRTYSKTTETYTVETDVYKYTINVEKADNSPLLYKWYVSGDASIIEGDDTNEVSLTYDANDEFYLSVAVSDSHGNSACRTYNSNRNTTSKDCNDSLPPSVPSDFTVVNSGYDQINLTWLDSTDNNGVIGYRLYRDGTLVSFLTATTYSDTGLSDETEYCYTVSAIDVAGNESTESAQNCATTSIYEVVAPTTPTNILVSTVSSTKVEVSWSASSDNVGVTGYKIFRNNEYIESVAETFYTDKSTDGNTQYCYSVSAYDEAGNESPKSIETCATTPEESAVLTKTKLLLGTWDFAYSIGSSHYDDQIILNSIEENSSYESGYVVTGEDEWGNSGVSGIYRPSYDDFMILDEGTYGEVYAFKYDGTSLEEGCWDIDERYNELASIGELDSCYTLTGSKTPLTE